MTRTNEEKSGHMPEDRERSGVAEQAGNPDRNGSMDFREASGTAPEPECSIYEYIKNHTKDGRLPQGFRIPWIQSQWAPGAQDGVSLYHMPPLQQNPVIEQMILKALELMSEEGNAQYTETIFAIFEELEKEAPIVKLYDQIVLTIIRHRTELDPVRLLNYGDWLICQGVSLLSVKLGLSVLSPFNVAFVEEVMTEFGVYDEFTYYAARVLSQEHWQNGNAELFRLAKKVRGWGRIHAVDFLEPETQEIRDWFLYEGADNDVIPQYSADVCLQKAGAESRLDRNLSAAEHEAIGKLIRAALEPGPCPGVTNGERIMPKFLTWAEKYPLDPALRRMICDKLGE